MDQRSVEALNTFSLEAIIALQETIGFELVIERGRITNAYINQEVR